MKIISAQWTGPDREMVAAQVVDSRGQTVTCHIPKAPPEEGTDWIHVQAWVDAGGEIADPE